MAGERRGLECEGWDRISYSKLGAERAGWMYTPGVRGAGGMYGRACAWGIGDGV
jgi:hypothetical protein